MLDQKTYEIYVKILNQELVLALGCTEPIAIAYAAAVARDVLGAEPEKIEAFCSGNIIKNVKGVTVPNSNGMAGIEAAVALGALAGNSSRGLQVLEDITEEDIQKAKKFIAQKRCVYRLAKENENLYIRIEAKRGGHTATTEIRQVHTKITKVTKDGKLVHWTKAEEDLHSNEQVDKSVLSVKGILQFANEMKLEDTQHVLEQQLSYNNAMSEVGLSKGPGAGVGKILLKHAQDALERGKAYAAAGVDARMSGCPLPVVINSGSGNQGMTISIPLAEYAKTYNMPHEKLLRALAMANLVAIHIKEHIGNLSAFCGATAAACGTICGIMYLNENTYEQISMAITNTLCNIGGMVCDGAKHSCATKIATALDAAFLAFKMALEGKTFCEGDGLVGENIEQTIDNIGRMSREGMRETDQEILHIMMGN